MMVMISYGRRPVDKVIEKGNFICPLCCRKRQYKRHKVIKEEFYGIISIPLGKIGQYIECQSCLRPFPIKVLSSSAQLSIKIENTPLPPSNIMEIWQNAYTTLKCERLLSSKTPITEIVEGISPILLTIAHHMQDAGVKIR
jgi:hypothetical protein